MAAALAADSLAGQWTHVARDSRHSGVAGRGPRELSEVAWRSKLDVDEEFVWRSSVVADEQRVYANVRVLDGEEPGGNRLVAFDRASGLVCWRCDLPADAFDSFSSPTLSPTRELALLGVDQMLFGVNTDSGVVAWQRPLARRIVNSSVALSDDLEVAGTPANRAFITDYAPFSTGTLYAINIDPYHVNDNPYQPGEIVWTATLAGSSGATPAYDAGRVFVACTSGQIRAYDARDGSLEWTRAGLAPGGFFGGAASCDGALFAATYNFFGGQNNSALFKLSAADGTVIWQTPCERTNSIPIVRGSIIYLSGGINGFGSVEKVQAFADFGGSAALLWDTAALSPPVGGWTFQPAWADGLLYVGTAGSGDDWSPSIAFSILDTEKLPGHSGFVRSVHVGSGGSPALADGFAYSFGVAGLFAFVGDPLGDMNCDGAVDVLDINPFVLALLDPLAYDTLYPECNVLNGDVNDDGQVNVLDINGFIGQLIGAGG